MEKLRAAKNATGEYLYNFASAVKRTNSEAFRDIKATFSEFAGHSADIKNEIVNSAYAWKYGTPEEKEKTENTPVYAIKVDAQEEVVNTSEEKF